MLLIVHASQPYVAVGNTTLLKILSLVYILEHDYTTIHRNLNLLQSIQHLGQSSKKSKTSPLIRYNHLLTFLLSNLCQCIFEMDIHILNMTKRIAQHLLKKSHTCKWSIREHQNFFPLPFQKPFRYQYQQS